MAQFNINNMDQGLLTYEISQERYKYLTNNLINLLSQFNKKAVNYGWASRYPDDFDKLSDVLKYFPVRTDRKKTCILIHLEENLEKNLAGIINFTEIIILLENFFQIKCILGKSIPSNILNSLEKRNNKIITNGIYPLLKTKKVSEYITKNLLICKSDLCPSETEFNFVFGENNILSSIVSVNRLLDNKSMAFERLLKLVIHEMGHSLRLSHCVSYNCVMNGINDLNELDSIIVDFCSECNGKIFFLTNISLLQKYTTLNQLVQFKKDSFYDAYKDKIKILNELF